MDGVNLRCTIREPVLNERTSAALGHTSSASSAEAVHHHLIEDEVCFLEVEHNVKLALWRAQRHGDQCVAQHGRRCQGY